MSLGGLELPNYSRVSAAERVAGWYQAAVAVAPRNPVTHVCLGVVLQAKGDLRDAEAEYRAAIENDENYAIAHAGLGHVLHSRGDLPGSETEYRHHSSRPGVRSRSPRFGEHVEAGGDLTGAETQYREAIRIDKNYALAHAGLGHVLQARNDGPGAEAEYREAIRLNIHHAFASNRLGELLRAKNDLPGAEAVYRQAIRYNSDRDLHNGLGIACIKGRFAGCRGRVSGRDPNRQQFRRVLQILESF